MSALALCIIIAVVIFIAALAGSKLAQNMLGVVTGIVLVGAALVWFITAHPM